MQLIRKLANYSADGGLALSIGNFDGLHLGHKSVLKHLLTESKKLNFPSAVMCFEPQPKEFLAHIKAPARLSRFRDKFIGLKELGIDKLFCLNFNQKFSSISAEDFIFEILYKKLNVKYLVVGDDFKFGYKGQGNYDLLLEYGKKLGFEVVSMDSFLHASKRISSTYIRELLSANDLGAIKDLLGENFFIRGKVSYGNQLGRTIDFPTANIRLQRRVAPVFGVYVVKVAFENENICRLLKKKEFYGVANVGFRPTVDGSENRLEVYIFDFNSSVYGEEIKVSFLQKLRDEKKFASLQELKQQILLDEIEARKYLKNLPV